MSPDDGSVQNDSKRPRQGGLTQLAAPLAVLALLAITAKLTIDARAAERSHRAAAESALRDYAAFASWQLSRQLASHLRTHLMMSLDPVRHLSIRPGASLPHPRILADRARQCNCGFKGDIALAFRFNLGGGRLIPDRPVNAEVMRDLARFLPSATDRIASGWSREGGDTAEMGGDMLRRTAAIAFDTLGGEPFVLAYGFVLDDETRPRALYGVASRLEHLAEDFGRILRDAALLPPSLMKGLPNDSLLTVRASHPATGTIYETAVAPSQGVTAHTDTLTAWLGGHVTTVAIRPELAATLLIGGIPASRLPLQLTLMAIAAALAIVALVQVRRTRELGRLRERFVANVSHELRTPLAQISMLGETLMLGRERSEQERRDFAAVVYREAGRLTTLVESVLRFSRGQAAVTRVRPESRDAAHDVREIVGTFEPIARSSAVTIDQRVPAGLTINADPDAFRQVLLNLLDNAVKFGPRGQSVVVDAAARNGAVEFSVTDQGRGVPERDRRRVFDSYTRLDLPDAPAVTGAGIGLSVVRDLVQAHGGRVWIETPPGTGGTRVVFTLPRSA
jgi:signal transduction histidine kinase